MGSRLPQSHRASGRRQSATNQSRGLHLASRPYRFAGSFCSRGADALEHAPTNPSLHRTQRSDFLRRMDYRTKAEFFIRGITGGFVEAAEVIAWSDEVIVAAEKTEDWMVEISSAGPDDRLAILSQLNTIKGTVDEAALAEMLKGRA